MIGSVFFLADSSLWAALRLGWAILVRNFDTLVLEPLHYPLLARSMEAAIIVGIVSGVLGTYVVVRGMAFFGDALAHAILPGVAIMYQRTNGKTDSLFLGGLVAGMLSALGIGFLTRHEKIREDTAIGVVFAAMFALGIAMISRMQNYAGDLTHILFGQILGVSPSSLRLTFIFGLIVLAVVVLFYKEFMIISFDSTLARTLHLPVETLRLLLLVLIAVTIVVSLQTVGVALMVALLVTPAATAGLMSKRLLPMMAISAIIGAASSIIGFYGSYHQNIPTGPAIVLTATGIFLFVFAEQQVTRLVTEIALRLHGQAPSRAGRV
ncbi:MAG TPA: metal ABC transporter permease [Aggregatilineaceae bacterium]|nr:metal ABC transporter permease [Aggregatilineaceae bacterium]